MRRTLTPWCSALLIAAASARIAALAAAPVAAALPPAPGGSSAPAFAAAWREGDLHVHDDHSSDGSLPRQISDDVLPGNVSVADQIGIAAQRGLDFLPLTDHRTFDQHADPLWTSAQLVLVHGEEANGSPHATVHGAVDTIVQGADAAGAPPRRKLQQSIWDAHSADADWSTAHPDDGETNDDGTPNDYADAVGMDLVEVWNRASNHEAEIAYAEDRWNRGWRFGVAGASDDHFREVWPVAGPGQPRTGTWAESDSEIGVVAGLRAGHTSLREDGGAPQIRFTAQRGDAQADAQAGDEIIAAAGTSVRLHLEVVNAAGATVTVYQSPGRSAAPLAQFRVGLFAHDAVQDYPVTVAAAPSWYRVEVRLGGGGSLPGHLLALSSPIFLSTAAVAANPAAPLPTDAGTDDGAQALLGAAGVYSGFADVAEGEGLTAVVAETHRQGRSEIDFRAVAADGSVAAAQRLSADAVLEARFPRVAARGREVWVVWQQLDTTARPEYPRIVLRHSGDGGQHWDAVQTVRQLDGRAEHPALALSQNGHPIVAWQEIASGRAYDIYAQVLGVDAAPQNLSGDGKTIAAANAFDTRSARYPASLWPSLAVAADGRIALAWQDDRNDRDPLWTGGTGYGDGSNPDDWQIAVRTRAAASPAWNPAAVLIGAADRAERHPSLAWTADGQLFAAWDQRELRPAGANLAVAAARSADGGLNWSATTIVSDGGNALPATMAQWPRLSTRDGGVRLAWSDGRSADWRWRIAVADGSAATGWGAVELLPAPGNNTWPALSPQHLVCASTRAAQRLQRDQTQMIYLRALP